MSNAFPTGARDRFAALYPETPGKITHALVDHPLLTLPALAELAQRLDPAHVEYNRADLPVGVDPASLPANELSIAETIKSIETNGSWMVLKWVENDPAYRTLLHETLAGLKAIIEPMTGEMLTLQGFIFASSPDAVTPFHMDPEHNILLQIRGNKAMTVFPADDASIVRDFEHERYHTGGHRNLPWRDEFAAKGETFALAPGDALHVPVKSPHWVKNGPALSISLSVTWRSHWSYREADARAFNALLRQRGLDPATTGRFPHQNRSKAYALRAVRRLRRLTGGAEI